MTSDKSDQTVKHHIETLVNEEHRLRSHKAPSETETKRLQEIQVELDQCWDLLRQRRALREFGENPDHAHVRPADVVENYEQ